MFACEAHTCRLKGPRHSCLDARLFFVHTCTAVHARAHTHTLRRYVLLCSMSLQLHGQYELTMFIISTQTRCLFHHFAEALCPHKRVMCTQRMSSRYTDNGTQTAKGCSTPHFSVSDVHSNLSKLDCRHMLVCCCRDYALVPYPW
jgi:hypothetical protein